MNKPDIDSRAQIEKQVDLFYARVLKDEVIGHIFSDVVQIDLAKHLPTMYDFWESVLLHTGNYRGNPMLKHVILNQKFQLTLAHFQRWLELWKKTVLENFQGIKADEACQKAEQIANLMKYKIGIQAR